MLTGLRAGMLGVVTAALLAGSWWGATSAFGAPTHLPKNAVVFKAEHVRGVKGSVLVEGNGLVVYTFTGDTRNHAGTCTGGCAAIWPPVRGVAYRASGQKFSGKFGRINGQVTYNGWPLYGFTGEKGGQNHANAQFKVVHPSSGHSTTPPPSTPSPMPTYTYSYGGGGGYM
jgi:predicted lipoprotein with Yx(FWY)xxD motif